MKDLSWFTDRIGKRVYRNETSCKCNHCKKVAKEGLIINDEMHAYYLHDIEGVSQYEESPVIYSDTKNTP